MRNWTFKRLLLFFIVCISPLYMLGSNAETSGVPVINIETSDTIKRKEYVLCTLTVVGDIPQEWVSSYDSVKIRGRGNTTWNEMPKKAYKIKFNKKESLFGEAKDKEWVLLANYSDETSIRTAVAFYMGNLSCLEWTPCSHFVELYLNGQYQGIYQLTEQIKISKNRVNIPKTGCILEVDHTWSVEEDDVWFATDRLLLNIKEPNIQYIDEQYEWVSFYVNEAEKVLYGDNFRDDISGYSKYYDVESFVDWYVISEITKNYDSQFHYSCWMSVEPGGKIKMGPLWDFDLSQGNKGWDQRALPDNYARPENFWLKGNTVWIDRMLEDETFLEKVKIRMSYFASHLDDIIKFIDEQGEQIKDPIIRNDKIWHTLKNTTEDDESIYSSYLTELEYLKDWIRTRMSWLSIQYPYGGGTSSALFNSFPSNNTTPFEGETLYGLDGKKHNVKPRVKGVYIHNGKKIIKKNY